MLDQNSLTKDLDDDFKGVIQQLRDLFVYGATKFRGRATHTWGVAAKGFARIIVPFQFPSNDLFRFGKQYRVVLRHASPGPQEDSRTLDGAAASIKFFDNDDASGDGIHDILMNSGRILFVRCARDFNTMVRTRMEDKQARKQLVTDRVVLDPILTEGYRTGSFTEFYYHSQICYELNNEFYLRYRLIPGDRGPERGHFPSSIRAEGRTTDTGWPDDRRAPDFLRRDFETRAAHLGIEYLLQGQIRPMDVDKDPWVSVVEADDVKAGHEPRALNPTVYWDERYYPWMDLALVRLDQALPEELMDSLNFDANRTHNSINLPLATNPKYDIPHMQADRYASFGHARALVYYQARHARAESPKPHVN